jgi:hypothetical protein
LRQFAVFVPFGVFVCSWSARSHERPIDLEVTRMSNPSFLSPVSKLLRFFCKSRDQWKAKCKAAKKEVNSLKIRLAAMKASRDRWKQQAVGQAFEVGTTAGTLESTTKNTAPSAGRSHRRRRLSAAGSRRGR